jgi:hypothetical protein
MKLWKKKKTRIDQVEYMKIWDSTQIYNFGRISGAADKGIATKAHYLSTPGPVRVIV